MSSYDQKNRNTGRSRRGADPAGAFGSYPEDGPVPAASPAPERSSILQRAGSALTSLRKRISLEDEADLADEAYAGYGDYDDYADSRYQPAEPAEPQAPVYEARAAAPYPQDAPYRDGAAPDDAFFSPGGWGEPGPDGWADPFENNGYDLPPEEPAQRSVRAPRTRERGDLAYTFWSAAIVAGILLTVFAFIYGCVA